MRKLGGRAPACRRSHLVEAARQHTKGHEETTKCRGVVLTLSSRNDFFNVALAWAQTPTESVGGSCAPRSRSVS